MPTVILDGMDPDFFYARVLSHTVPGVYYEVTGDCRNGVIRCSCMDASCRRKRGSVLDPSLPACKHLADFWAEIHALNALADYDEYEQRMG